MAVRTGKISQVIGPVVDVRFSTGDNELPNILDALEVTKSHWRDRGTRMSTAHW